MIISVFDIGENIVGKGEIACTSNFSFSHNVFKRLLSQTRQKVSLCGNGLILLAQAVLYIFTAAAEGSYLGLYVYDELKAEKERKKPVSLQLLNGDLG